MNQAVWTAALAGRLRAVGYGARLHIRHIRPALIDCGTCGPLGSTARLAAGVLAHTAAGMERVRPNAVNPTITMRPIRSQEGAALRDIRVRAIRDAPDAFAVSLAETLSETAEGWTAWATQAAQGETRILYVAEDAGQWIALAGGTIDPSGPADSADLISLWVDPAYRGQGLGRRLVAHVLGWAHERGRHRVALWVTETNTAAIVLYARCGFREVGESQRLPSDPTLVERRMVRSL